MRDEQEGENRGWGNVRRGRGNIYVCSGELNSISVNKTAIFQTGAHMLLTVCVFKFGVRGAFKKSVAYLN